MANNSGLKRRLLNEGLLEARCYGEGCAVLETWLGTLLVLQLDHINGDRTDDRIENLRLLCPNCHSQTITWAGRKVSNLMGPFRKCTDCGCRISKMSNRCIQCSQLYISTHPNANSSTQRRFEITKEKLEQLLSQCSWREIGQTFNVSYMAVKKRAKRLGITFSTRKPYPNRLRKHV